VTVVFLDRDGVINRNSPGDYVRTWEEFVFLPGVKMALRRLAEREDIRVFIVSNQAGVGKGQMTAERVERIHQLMKREIEDTGGRLDGIFYCPHRSEESCSCRKPRSGLLRRALEEAGIETRRIFIVGDALSDMEAGQGVSAVSIMVKTGRGREQLESLGVGDPTPDFVVEDISEAVEIILNGSDSMTEDYRNHGSEMVRRLYEAAM
jgi:histidinol-phosphate phosphatase family protein